MLYEVAYYSDFIYINVYSRYMNAWLGKGLLWLLSMRGIVKIYDFYQPII